MIPQRVDNIEKDFIKRGFFEAKEVHILDFQKLMFLWTKRKSMGLNITLQGEVEPNNPIVKNVKMQII
jgi:hypothetical protein